MAHNLYLPLSSFSSLFVVFFSLLFRLRVVSYNALLTGDAVSWYLGENLERKTMNTLQFSLWVL